IAMVDVDHFKKFNDTHGHHIGDQVLRMVAGHLQKVGGGGKAFRYGGEEFTVLFPSRTLKEAAQVMDEVREAIGDGGFRIRTSRRAPKQEASGKRGQGGGREVKVTVSVGLAEQDAERVSAQEVIKAADEKLYQAKKKGRNRVCR
ncbi:MAG TPA: GGDEF domain-containing protein, partial [Gammaproteobacteria bacterium]|nr:GGDEF domain-containing protein [Gammaproteobacteria bacterium]